MEFDKFKTCKDCPDRRAQPNCHTDCEGYLARCEELKRIKEEKIRQQEIAMFDYVRHGKVAKIMDKNRRRAK